MKGHFLWLLKNIEIEIHGGTFYASGAEKKTGTDSPVWLFGATMDSLDDSNVLVFDMTMDSFLFFFFFLHCEGIRVEFD